MTERPLRTARVSLRLRPQMREQLTDIRATLADAGLHATESELIETFIAQGLQRTPNELEATIRNRRATAP